MVAMSILGLSWCQHAGWMVVLYDAASGRRLQITLRLEDALVLGQELSRQPTDRSGLYTLVGTLLRHQPQPASVNLSLAEAQRAGAALVVRTVDGQFGCPTSTADGIALAVRAGLPLFADEALLDSFGVGPDPDHPRDQHDAPSRPEIPHAFRLALGEQPDDAA